MSVLFNNRLIDAYLYIVYCNRKNKDGLIAGRLLLGWDAE